MELSEIKRNIDEYRNNLAQIRVSLTLKIKRQIFKNMKK